jgi:hypothetical protein
MQDWLGTKRYVFFSKRSNRFISVTTEGLRVLSTPYWGSLLAHTRVLGPFPGQEAIRFVKWINGAT